MADKTQIEWADATLNYVNGCTRISPGCGGPGPHGGCYAERLAGTRMRNHPSRVGLTRETDNGPRWTGEIRLNEKALQQAMTWRRPRRIFWNAHGDLFHDNVPEEAIDRLFAVCALTPHHTHMILTKRPARMRAYWAQLDIYALEETDEWRAASYRIDCDDDPNGSPAWHKRTGELEDCFVEVKRLFDAGFPLPNVWLGVSVEDQQRADERIPELLATPAAIRFLSCEPLLGPVDLRGLMYHPCPNSLDGLSMDPETGSYECCSTCDWSGISDELGIDWVIVGGESGPKARPMHPDWARSLRDQCKEAGVPFFFKQWGEWAPNGSADIYRHGPQKNQRQFPGAPGISWLADGRICLHDFTVAEHRKRMATGIARDSRAVEVDRGALADFNASIELKSGPINPLGYQWMYQIGKKAAGRLLDGLEHNGMPGGGR